MNNIWLNAIKASSITFVGAYDDIPNLVHLYEMARRGLTSYGASDPLVRIRRDSDNAEQDFTGVSNGALDTAAITTFLGGANPFVVTVYDQVGSDDPTQATAGSQPAYVASGQNSKPIMRFDGSDDYLQTTLLSNVTQPYHTYGGGSLDAVSVNDGSSRVLVDGDDNTNSGRIQQYGVPAPDTWMIFAGVVLSDNASDSNANLFTALFNSTSSDLRKNASSVASGNAGTDLIDGLTIGAVFNGGANWDGDVYMVAIADPSHSDTERGNMETAINDYWSIY